MKEEEVLDDEKEFSLKGDPQWLTLVESVMRVSPVEALLTDTVSKISEMLLSNDIGSIVVVADSKPVGIITERDVMEKVVRAGRDPNKTTAKEIMTSPIVAIEHNKSVSEALKLMREKRIRRLAVTQNGKLVGIVTERRLLSVAPVQKILVPIDESDTAKKALDVALDLAKQYSSEICILHVIQSPKIPVTIYTARMHEDEQETEEKKSKQLLEKAFAKAAEAGVGASTRLGYGEPADKIVQIADEEGFNLIVMGAKRKSTMRRFILGSVSSKVTHTASCPTFIVR
jgi:nucleotide-binding universal stress UspA family protein/CBS domain-containing protein